MEQTRHIPPLNEAPVGKTRSIFYDGRTIDVKTFKVRGMDGTETYAVAEPPYSHPFTKISVFKLREDNV